MSATTFRVSINYKDKIILLSKPLDQCEYFKHNSSYIDGTYKIHNELVEVHKDPKNYRESHYVKSYKIAKILFDNLKTTKKDYFFYNTMNK